MALQTNIFDKSVKETDISVTSAQTNSVKMVDRTVSSEIIDIAEYEFVRPQIISVTVLDARPNSILNVFFEDKKINNICKMWVGAGTQNNPNILPGTAAALVNDNSYSDGNYTAYNKPIFTNEVGETRFVIVVPANYLKSGNRSILVTDAKSLEELNIVGTKFGFASAVFTSKGLNQTIQETTTEYYENTITTTFTVNVKNTVTNYHVFDPLAQSFFTYGKEGGIFLTSIEVYFQTKDPNIPVKIELREMINGFPATFKYQDPNLSVTVNPDDVNVSDDASLPTKFKFNKPIYLPEDSDFCFIVRSNSDKYNIWISHMGDRSVETDQIIHEQPYVGSIFRSENDITWTPNQFEDIKFKLNIAEFQTGSVSIPFYGHIEPELVDGSNLYTRQGSNVITVTYPRMHGLKIGGQVTLEVEPGTTLNGIDAQYLNKTHPVTDVLDAYTFIISILDANSDPVDANVTGPMSFGDSVQEIIIEDGGSGYSDSSSIIIDPPASGVQATAILSVDRGTVTSVVITNSGSGYTSAPNITITNGVGAVLKATLSNFVIIHVNKPIARLDPDISIFEPPKTAVSGEFQYINDDYGSLGVQAFEADKPKLLDFAGIVASTANANYHLGAGVPSFTSTLTISSSNKNVSPVIDLASKPYFKGISYAINNQGLGLDDLNSNNSSSGVTGVSVINGGNGYASAPAVTVVPSANEPNVDNITPAVITSSISGGSVNGLSVANAGSGYTRPPQVIIAPPPSGIQAVAGQVQISQINSEINTAGTAYSRYITEMISIQQTSNAVLLISTIYSTPETSVDWYIRTSLSTSEDKHEDQKWQLMTCEVARDKSTPNNPFYDYQFTVDGLEDFDRYDLKCVFSSIDSAKIPAVTRYRVIVAS